MNLFIVVGLSLTCYSDALCKQILLCKQIYATHLSSCFLIFHYLNVTLFGAERLASNIVMFPKIERLPKMNSIKHSIIGLSIQERKKCTLAVTMLGASELSLTIFHLVTSTFASHRVYLLPNKSR